MKYNETIIVANGIEHWQQHVTGLVVSNDEEGNIILTPTDMGVATDHMVLSPDMRDDFVKILMRA